MGCDGLSDLGIMGHISKKKKREGSGSFLLWGQIIYTEDALMGMSLGSMERDSVK